MCQFFLERTSIGFIHPTTTLHRVPWIQSGTEWKTLGLTECIHDLADRWAATYNAGERALWRNNFLFSSLSGNRWRWTNGENFIPSGCIPDDGDLSMLLKPRGRWATLQCSSRVHGLFCKVLGLGCYNLFFRDPWSSCTEIQNEWSCFWVLRDPSPVQKNLLNPGWP